MATKTGVVYGTTSNEYIDVRLRWEELSENNYYVYLEYKRNNSGYETTGTGDFRIEVWPDATHFYTSSNGSNKKITITEDEWVTACSTSAYAMRGDDGTGTIKIFGRGSIPGTTLTTSLVTLVLTPDPIDRATSLDALSCSTSDFTGTLTYKYTPQRSSLYNRCNISLNLDGNYIAVKSITLGQKEASQQTGTVTLSASELSTIYNKLPNSKSGKLRFTFRTYKDSEYSTEVTGSGVYKEINLSIPNTTDTQPTMTMTLSPVSDLSLGAIYVKTLSKVKAAFTNGAGKYGASIVSYKMTVAGKDYASPYTSEYLATAGSITVKGTITDSRGFSRVYSQNISVIDYTTPTLNSLTCDTSYFTGTLTYKYTPPNNVFYSQCVVTLGGTTIKTISLGQKSAGQQTATLTFGTSELSTIYNLIPNSAQGTLKFIFRSYIDSSYSTSKKIGADSSKEKALTIPNDDTTKPTATLTVSPVSSLASPFNSLYIRGKTKASVTLENRTGKYGATIKSYSVTVGTQSGTPPFTSAYLTASGNITVTGTVTDSRGFSRTYTNKITVIDHSAPRIIPISGQSEVIAARCNAEGALDVNGTYLLIAAKRSYSKVEVSGVQKNFCKIQYRYKVDGGSYSSWVDILARTAADDEVLTGALLAGALVTTSTYVVQIRAIDDIGDSVSTTIFVPTEKVYMHRAGSINAIGIGKYAEEENTFDVAEDWDAIFRGKVEVKGGYIPVEIPQYSDFNNLIIPNTYYARYTYVPDFVNCPITDQTTFALEVIAMGKDGQVLQRITRCSAEATVYERQYYSYTWHEWEVVNPPMIVGEEYRTTERYMGKPVYTKLIFCDTLPNTTYKLFPHGAAVKQAIRCVGQMSDGNSLPFRFNATNYVEIYAGPENVVIFAGNDKTNRSAYAQMWYVKD